MPVGPGLLGTFTANTAAKDKKGGTKTNTVKAGAKGAGATGLDAEKMPTTAGKLVFPLILG
ncbi:hypothetical protein GJ744_007910 [Endocarpon pusillum]|uniref:Uncharacterized protein n=1 Tax=Endocarpon pusillum TaxID=364733 RepID=A0A8H7AQW7_9EURO|nr:hypothetical protein GJ744_007910 [Endocarpon pusillum]